jgi:signal peptidase I
MKLGENTFAVLGSELLRQGFMLRCCTIGSSMFPLIKTGNIVEIKPVRIEDLKIGDIVLYKSPAGPMVAHRLLKKSLRHGNMRLITKGDSFPWWAIEYVDSERVLGKLTAITRGIVKKKVDGFWGRYWGVWLTMLSPFAGSLRYTFQLAKYAVNYCHKFFQPSPV